MKFEPKTDDQIAEEMLIPDGVYDFEVASAKETTSSKGSPMIALELRLWDANGTPRIQRDWLVGSTAPLCIKKIKNFCATTGLDYEGGEFTAEECVSRTGKLLLGNKTDPEYGPQNTVKDYKTESSTEKQVKEAPRGPTAAQSRQHAQEPDDQIPF